MSIRAAGKVSLKRLIIHLLHRAVQRADETFLEEVEDQELTPRQFAVLLCVAQNDGPSQLDIAALTGIDRSTTTDLVQRLVKKGLLQRQRRKNDARAYLVRLTEAGQKTLASVEAAVLRADARIVAALSLEHRRAFMEALTAIAAGRGA